MSLQIAWPWDDGLDLCNNEYWSEEGSSSLKDLKWLSWLYANYECSPEGNCSLGDVMAEADKAQARMPSPFSMRTLGHIIFEKWGNGGITRRIPTPLSHDIRFNDLLNEMSHLQLGWFAVMDRLDSISFVRHHSFAYRNRRVFFEVELTHTSSDDLTYALKSHGNIANLEEVVDIPSINKFPLKCMERVNLLLAFIDSCQVCDGVLLEQVNNIDTTMAPHIKGTYDDLKKNPTELEKPYKKAYAIDCNIICSPGNICPNCTSLLWAFKKRRNTGNS